MKNKSRYWPILFLLLTALLTPVAHASQGPRVYSDLDDCENTFLLKINVRATNLGVAYGYFNDLIYHGVRSVDAHGCTVEISMYAKDDHLADRKVLKCLDVNPIESGAY